MKNNTTYNRLWFDKKAIAAIFSEYKKNVSNPNSIHYAILSSKSDSSEWDYDTPEDFIFNFNQKSTRIYCSIQHPELSIVLSINNPKTDVYSTSYISVESKNRDSIVNFFEIIEKEVERCTIPEPPKPKPPPKLKPKIFIGHGGSKQWRDLKDHLTDHHKYEVVAYETGSRAGHAIRDVIVEMLSRSSIAILVMTGEDEMQNGTFRARQNVIHEMGLFQGKLGFTKAIVLLEEETEEFSNIIGIQQIRFKKGNIKETFGDVLAVLKREFGEI